MNFYLNKNGQKLGPYSVEQIQIFLKQGLVTTADQAWADGWSSWMPIGNVPGLAATEPSVQTRNVPQAPTQVHQPDYSPTSFQPQQSGGIYAQGKNPVIACVLSLVIVGTGQFYNGDWGKGCFLLITCILASVFSWGTLWLLWALMSAIDAYMVASKRRPLRGSFFKF